MPFVYTEDWPITVESVANAGAQTQSIDTRTVSADYFTTMQTPLVVGQVFSAEDGPQAQPVVRIKIGNADSKSPWFTVKGVVRDSAQAALDRGIRPEIYFALGQMAGRYRRMNLAVRTSVDPKNTLAAIQSAIREIDKDQPVYQRGVRVDAINDKSVVWCDCNGHTNLCFSFAQSIARRVSRVSHSGETRNASRSIGGLKVRVKREGV